MSLPPAATPSEERSSTTSSSAPLPPRWYVVALVVGIAMAALPLALGTLLALDGNALSACNNEMECIYFYFVGLCAAPVAFVCSAVASGLKARRLATTDASRARTWKEGGLRIGFVALFAVGLPTMLALAPLC